MVRLSCRVSLGTIFYKSPKRNCRGVSMGVDLGLAFCPGDMGLDTSGHRTPGRRIGLGSSSWFPGVSLPSCAKPNKLLNNHVCWVLFLKGHEFGDIGPLTDIKSIWYEDICRWHRIFGSVYMPSINVDRRFLTRRRSHQKKFFFQQITHSTR